MTSDTYTLRIPKREIDVVELGRRARKGRIALNLGRDVKFSTTALESYSFARWESVIYDAMVVGATIEYGDRIVRRPSQGWTRRISLRIPVHDPDRWTAPNVSVALHDAVEFLTGDYWSISFVKALGVRSISVPELPESGGDDGSRTCIRRRHGFIRGCGNRRRIARRQACVCAGGFGAPRHLKEQQREKALHHGAVPRPLQYAQQRAEFPQSRLQVRSYQRHCRLPDGCHQNHRS